MNHLKLKKQLQQFFLEDFGDGDVTSETIFSLDQKASGQLVAKQDGIFAGRNIIIEGYSLLDPGVAVHCHVNDGDPLKNGQTIAEVEGLASPILTGERVLLNLIQRMSGIATLTKQAVKRLNSLHTRICDTRKTMPGLRMFDKYAVRCGGGYNHRHGLYDGVMIKDNHIACLGSIQKAVTHARNHLGHMVKIEVETETKEEVLEAVEVGADVIMFDNRTPEEIHDFVECVPRSIITEASGGIDFEHLSAYGNTNVDYISLGLLTHSVPAFDISLDMTTLYGRNTNE